MVARQKGGGDSSAGLVRISRQPRTVNSVSSVTPLRNTASAKPWHTLVRKCSLAEVSSTYNASGSMHCGSSLPGRLTCSATAWDVIDAAA